MIRRREIAFAKRQPEGESSSQLAKYRDYTQ